MSIRQTLLYAFCLFFLATGIAHAELVTVDDSYGVPISRFLQVEAPGVLNNDTLDGNNAGESGVTATLLTGTSKGTLTCPGVGPGLCANGSFEYTPGTGFDGIDSFQYEAVSVSTSETSPPTTVTLTACAGGPTVFTCWLEAPYLAKLSDLGLNNTFVESFEGTTWDVARTPSTAPSILSKGITWTTNHPTTNGITTGTGPARTGLWGVYDRNHGSGTGSIAECAGENPPAYCFTHDGFSGSMAGPDILYGVGGYISGDFGANIDIILDGIPHNIGPVPGSGNHFMGVIHTAGFNAFEYRELEGTIEQLLRIFGDDFTIATSATLPANNPPVLAAIGDQSTGENIQLSIPLSATDVDDGDHVSFSMSGAPTGAELYDNGDGTADFFWTPDYSQAGSYLVTFTVTDNGIPSASDSETITITVNDVNRPPVLSAIGNKSVNENIELSFLLTASDPDGHNLSFVKSGGPTEATLTDHGDGTATFSWTPNFGEAGDHPVTFTVTDNGVPVASDLETITITVIGTLVDITPPQVQITSPVNGASLNGTPVTVSGTASDETALTSVTVNGVAATVVGGNFNASVTLVEGANSITAIATDSSGNTANTSIQVTYTPPDITPPLVQINSPANGATLTSASVTVSGTASDETALTGVTVNGVAATVVGGNFNASVTLVEGANSITAVATDSSGNTTSTSIQVTYTPPDITPPLVQINSPANGATLTSASVTVSGTASDETALTGVTVNGIPTTLGSGTFSASVALVAGTNTLTAVATDSSGNTASTSIQVTYTPPDVTPPQVQILSPANGATLTSASVTVSGTASDDTALASVTVNGVAATLGSGTFSANVALVAGTNTLTAIAADASGNTASTSIQVTYTPPDITPPQVQILSPANGASLNGTPVTVSGTASDDTALASVTVNGVPATLGSGTFSASVALVAGSNTLTAIATDASGNTTSTSIQVTFVVNTVPVANAGLDQTALVYDTVTLDGSGSSDADGDTINYSWSLTPPAGSTAVLSDPTAVNPSFMIDIPGNYVAQLIVNDGTVDSAADTVNISTSNSAPVANAGTDQTALVNDTVVLDGSSSTDVDGDALTYSWSLTTPAGSTASLSDTKAVNPDFTIDLPGTYSAQLIVNDGKVDSTADTVSISTSNSAPVADAGADQSSLVGNTVTLNGSGSSDVDGDTLSFSWSLNVAPGSSATISDTTAVNPSFVIDVPGTYIAQLIVNDGSVNSAADTVTISTTNSAPVANAGADQTALVGNMVTLDGSGSTDADGDALSYSWSLTVPAGSAASLSDPTVVNPDFNIDVSGIYIAQLIVNDTTVSSAPDTVNISTTNSAPVADAGIDQTALVNDTVMLDGSSSSDADGDALTFSWALTTVPAGSVAVLTDPAAVSPSFDADLTGTYVVQLIVNDGSLDSAADTVSIITSSGIPGNLQFSKPRYKVNENVGSAIITVERVGGSDGAVSVDYATSNDTASAGSDYIRASGTLSFAAGVTSQSFKITILQDTKTENNESLTINLSNPDGGAGLGLTVSATVVIADDDAQTDVAAAGGSSSGSIDVITLMLLFSLYLRNFRKKNIYKY